MSFLGLLGGIVTSSATIFVALNLVGFLLRRRRLCWVGRRRRPLLVSSAASSACLAPLAALSACLESFPRAMAAMPESFLPTSSSRVVALSSRFLRFLAVRTVLAMSLDRRVAQEVTSAAAELTAQGRPGLR